MLKRNSKSLGEIIEEFMEENSFIKTKIAEQRAVSAWSELLGSGVSKYTKSVYLKRNVLHVHLVSSVLRAELQMNKPQLIEKLNEVAGMTVVKDIILR